MNKRDAAYEDNEGSNNTSLKAQPEDCERHINARCKHEIMITSELHQPNNASALGPIWE
jgi:hypothetical protein